MQVKKAIKRIVALGAGTVMMAATMAGALAAADLANYPTPFVSDGVYDAFIVVGDKAAAEDVIGAVDIGAGLQYSMKKTTTVSAGATEVVIDQGYKVDKVGNALNPQFEDVYDVKDTGLDDADLPTVLADGTYTDSKGQTDNDETYTQRIYLYDNQLKPMFYQDDTDAPLAGVYFYVDDSSSNYAYNYTLKFDDVVSYTNTSTDTPADDLKSTKINIQGNDYTITGVSYDSNYKLKKITLMAGDTMMWLTQDQVVTKTIEGVDHEIMVVDVSESEDSCGVSVDGSTVWIDVGDTETINGVNVGVVDAKAVHAQLQDVDICEINLGAKEIALEHTKKPVVDGKKIDNSNTYFIYGTSNPGTEWSGISIVWSPSDDTYLAKGQYLVDPVFGQFKFQFEGLNNEDDFEEMSLTRSGDRAEFEFLNLDGKTVEIPFYYNSTNQIEVAKDSDEKVLQEGDTCTGSSSITDCEGYFLWVVTSGYEAHLIKIADIDTVNNQTDFDDLTYGRSYDDRDTNLGGTASNIELGSVGTIQLTMNSSLYTVVADNLHLASSGTYAETKNRAQINFGAVASTNTSWVEVYEYQPLSGSGSPSAVRINLTMTSDTTNNEIDFSAPTNLTAGSGTFKWYDKEDGADDDMTMSQFGTIITYDSVDDDEVTLLHPEGEATVNVFIAPVSAIVTAGGGEVETTELEQINVGAARLASEISAVDTNNLVVVGGPCANAVAATLMGVTYAGDDCATDFTEGKAMIKLYEHDNGKVAMLVAGMTAMDTRRATRVVHDYASYPEFTGTEVEVTGTSLTDITVSAPATV